MTEPNPRSERPLRLLLFFLGSVSVGTLLLYLHGWMPMQRAAYVLLAPSAAAVVALFIWARKVGRAEIAQRIAAGAWAGALATLFYDVVRVPIVWSGVPVFKAISYFGMVIVGQSRPGFLSEAVGWAYHFSNGVGFGLMYAVLVRKPRWWTAVAWGLFLELAMLLTPYAEVFGYKVGSKFLGITIGSHVVYGLALWLALRYWLRGGAFGAVSRRSGGVLWSAAALAAAGVGATGVDFNMRHGSAIPEAPPPYIGPHLYATWDVLEPDRVIVLWLHKKHVDPDARYRFVSAFTPPRFGTPIDLPEATVRRSGGQAATVVLLRQLGLESEPGYALLGRVAQLYEITPWALPSDVEAQALGEKIRAAFAGCEGAKLGEGRCLEAAFALLDAAVQAAERP